MSNDDSSSESLPFASCIIEENKENELESNDVSINSQTPPPPPSNSSLSLSTSSESIDSQASPFPQLEVPVAFHVNQSDYGNISTNNNIPIVPIQPIIYDNSANVETQYNSINESSPSFDEEREIHELLKQIKNIRCYIMFDLGITGFMFLYNPLLIFEIICIYAGLNGIKSLNITQLVYYIYFQSVKCCFIFVYILFAINYMFIQDKSDDNSNKHMHRYLRHSNNSYHTGDTEQDERYTPMITFITILDLWLNMYFTYATNSLVTKLKNTDPIIRIRLLMEN